MEITQEQYRRIEPELPRQRGNVSLSNLTVLNAILYVAEQGCKWRGLPKRFGNWHTIYTRMNRWSKNGVLDAVFDDESEVKEGEEHDVEFIETGEDTPKTLESAEEPLDFVPAAVENAVVFPRLQAVALGRHDGNPPKIQSQLAGLVVLVGTVHQQRQRRGQRPQAGEQIAALRGVVRLAGRERKRYRRSSISRQPDESWWSIHRGICRSTPSTLLSTRR